MSSLKPILDWFASTAWPLTLVFFALFFRHELRSLLSNLGGVVERVRRDRVEIAIGEKFKIQFSDEIKKVEEEVGRLLPPGSQGPPSPVPGGNDAPSPSMSTIPDRPTPLPPNYYLDRLYKLAELSPRASILEAWREVELGVEEVASYEGILGATTSLAVLAKVEYGTGLTGPPLLTPALLARRLVDLQLIDTETFRIFEDLRQLRAQASHASDFQPTIESAREYARVAINLVQRIKSFGGRRGYMKYNDGTEVKVGHVVVERGIERYLVIGPGEGTSVRILLIGTVQKEGSPSFGETIILPQGFIRTLPASVLTRIGSARIQIVDHDPII
jgi:hypothetical protein